MKKFLAKTLFITLMTTGSSMAQTLEEAMAIAYENNYLLKSKREELKVVDENIMRAFSNFLPTVGVGGRSIGQSNSKPLPSPYNPSTISNSSSSSGMSNSLELKQNIFKSGGDLAALKQAKRSIEQQRAELIFNEQKVLLNVVQVYLNVAQAQMKLDIYEKKVATLTKYLEGEEARFKAGEKTKTDVAQAKSYLSKAVADRIKAVGDLASAKANFVATVTVEPQNIVMPNGSIVVPTNPDEAVEVALKKNPALMASENRRKAADQHIHVQRASLLPSANVSYSMNRSSDPDSPSTNQYYNSDVAALNVNIPILDSSNWSQLRAAKRQAQQYKYDSLNTKESVIDGAIVAWQDYETSKASIHAQEDAVESALVAYNGMKEEEKAGTRSSVDVIVTQNNYFDTDINLVTAKANNIQNRYVLKSAVGELTAKDLGLQVSLYDPLKNYNKIKWELIGSF